MEAEAVPLNIKTIGSTIAYCNYLAIKGYASTAQVEPWKTALKRVFETVEGPGYESLDWSSIDLDEYLDRFSTLASAKTTWKVESIVTYGRRVRNALDAHAQFIESGRPPSFRKSSGSARKAEATPKPSAATVEHRQAAVPVGEINAGPRITNLELTYPLGPGRNIQVLYPPNLSKREIDRFCRVMQTLEEQPQLPPGDALAA